MLHLPTRLYAEACALVNQGRYEDASQRLDQVIATQPDFAEAFSLGGYILERGGNIEAALRFYSRAVSLRPSLAVAWFNLAKLLTRQTRCLEALEAIQRGLALSPKNADAHNTLSGILRGLGRVEEAARAAKRALKLQPLFPEAALNLGTALLKSCRPQEALAAYEKAALQRQNYADALCGQGLALRALGRFEEARAVFNAAKDLGCREAISGLGCLDLTLGNFAQGWAGYEARWIDGKSIAEVLGSRLPFWQGPGSAARRVLVVNDHGLGDTIQFARYLPLMRAAGVKPHFLCPAKMHRLLAPLVEGHISERESAEMRFDAQIALSSLPYAFGTRLETIPAHIPYLFAEAERITRWAAEIGEGGLRIGCVWQGNPNPEADFGRSFPLAALAPLAHSARLISLQRGVGVEQISAAPFPIQRLSPSFDAGGDAFIDTAAAMMSLDLIITCDTSIAHLAGALGRPVWVALKTDSEWRWMRERDTSPWYPTMRLFRQKHYGDWDSVFAAITTALSGLG